MPPRTRIGTKEIFLKAVKENNLREVRDWIGTVDINMKDNKDYNNTPLMIAAGKGYKELVELLLSNGANVNQANTGGDTALSFAIRNGHTDIVQGLIAAGADVNHIDNNQYTPLVLAIINRVSIDIAKNLIDSGANINFNFTHTLYGKNTVLSFAVKNNRLDIVKLLIDANVDFTKYENTNPIIIAARYGFTPIVEALITAGIDKNTVDKNKDTPLLAAVNSIKINTIKFLLQVGADPNMQNNQGVTPLISACYAGNEEIIKALLEAGANPNQITKRGTPLICLVDSGTQNTILLDMLINAGADLNQKDTQGSTPFFVAILRWNIPLIKKLLEKGVNPNITVRGESPLIKSIYYNSFDLVKLLLDANADVNVEMSDGNTALSLAVYMGSIQIVKDILDKNPKLTNLISKMIKKGNIKPEILTMLKEHYPITSIPWKGQSRGNIEKFDTLFESEESMRNWSFCPICLGWIQHVEGCMYMTHKCRDMPYYHEELYNKYKNRDGEINWCTICGRICAGHYHYPIVDAKAAKPRPLVLIGAHPFDDDCRLTNGGGGLPEKIARIRQLRETTKELQSEVGKIGYEEAMNIRVEDAWNTALRPENQKVRNIAATKTWNIPATNFPPNVATNTAANVIANANDPTKYSAPTILSPGTGAAQEGRNAGYEYNTVSFADDIPLIVFKHKDKDGNERIHPQISKDSFLADLMTSERRGKCFDPDCGGLLYPREIELAFADPKLAPTITEKDRAKVAKYKEWFNKWHAEDAKRGGRRRTRRHVKVKRRRTRRA